MPLGAVIQGFLAARGCECRSCVAPPWLLKELWECVTCKPCVCCRGETSRDYPRLCGGSQGFDLPVETLLALA